MAFPAFPRIFSVNKYERKCSSYLLILPTSSLIGKVQCLRKKEKNSDAIDQRGYKGQEIYP